MTLDEILAHAQETGHAERGYEAGGLEWHCHVCGPCAGKDSIALAPALILVSAPLLVTAPEEPLDFEVTPEILATLRRGRTPDDDRPDRERLPVAGSKGDPAHQDDEAPPPGPDELELGAEHRAMIASWAQEARDRHVPGPPLGGLHVLPAARRENPLMRLMTRADPIRYDRCPNCSCRECSPSPAFPALGPYRGFVSPRRLDADDHREFVKDGAGD